jgi:hypothetical protein
VHGRLWIAEDVDYSPTVGFITHSVPKYSNLFYTNHIFIKYHMNVVYLYIYIHYYSNGFEHKNSGIERTIL